ncbi:MED14-domain-containing protein [Violaceomyces palustris]|uniref:MED14-domain-containing protein n=1 Tax=Violaceomyces palustris TaxID=1673888 RepID=A0ACD0P064_9BASI|nr:MED14-domain-containing protein [Violaceomyces palustris]
MSSGTNLTPSSAQPLQNSRVSPANNNQPHLQNGVSRNAKALGNGFAHGNGAASHGAEDAGANGVGHAPPVHKLKQVGGSPTSTEQRLNTGIPPASTPSILPKCDTAASDMAVTANKGKARHIDPLDHVPYSQLEAELPREEADLIPMAALIERMANFGYESLQNLAETLPSLPSSSKRAKLFTTALDVRKQFVKLLVLVRWSKDLPELQRARNIIALLTEQQWQHEDVFAGLTDIRKTLPNARMRNADLPTAIDVLRTGSYNRLPASIKDSAVALKPLTDEEAIEIVGQLDDALRMRMACNEIVPLPMSQYHVSDGRVHFKCPGLFEAQLTASGSGIPIQGGQVAATDRWWLLTLKFDLRIVGAGADTLRKAFPRIPKKAYKERLRIWGDKELEPREDGRSLPPLTQDDGQQTLQERESAPAESSTPPPAEEQTEEPTPISPDKGTCRDAPLARLYAFLQERALHYQLDILHHQALELTRLNWGSSLSITMEQRLRCLVIKYWAGVRAAGSASTSKAKPGEFAGGGEGPAEGGIIRISIGDEAEKSGIQKTIATLLAGEECSRQVGKVSDNQEKYYVKKRKLLVTWEVDKTISAEVGAVDLSISPHALDLEALLLTLVKRHSAALLRVLQQRILSSNHPLSRSLSSRDCTLRKAFKRARNGSKEAVGDELLQISYLHIRLGAGTNLTTDFRARRSGTLELRLEIDSLSGMLKLRAEDGSNSAVESADIRQGKGCVSSTWYSTLSASPLADELLSARLREATERLNKDVVSLTDILYKLGVLARVEEWESMATYAGLQYTRRLNFRPTEFAKFGPSLATCGPPVLYLPLAQYPTYYLALQPSERNGLNVALICAVTLNEGTGASFVAIQSIEWLDRAKIAKGRTLQPAAIPGGTKSQSETQALGKRKREAESLSVFERGLTIGELTSLHSYSVALVSYLKVEQQLRVRGIPFVHVLPSPGQDTSSYAVPCSTSDAEGGASAIVPSLCLRSVDLLGSKANLAKPNVLLRVSDWWDRTSARVQIAVKLKMRSRRFKTIKKILDRMDPASLRFSAGARSWIEFDESTSVLRYSTKDMDNCVAGFLNEWALTVKLIEVVREVLTVSRGNRLKMGPSALRRGGILELREFDLDTATFAYGYTLATPLHKPAGENGEKGEKLSVRVRWQDDQRLGLQSSGGRYALEFGSTVKDEQGNMSFKPGNNPHLPMAFELQRAINHSNQSLDQLWRGFFQLLRDTLPVIRVIGPFADECLKDADCPELEVRSSTWFRIRFLDTHALDIRLVRGSRFLLCDASQPLFRSPIKGLELAATDASKTQGPDLVEAVQPISKAGYSLRWTDEQSTQQHRPLPEFRQLVKEVYCAFLKECGSRGWGSEPGGFIHAIDLRRALLCSASEEVMGFVLPRVVEGLKTRLRRSRPVSSTSL